MKAPSRTGKYGPLETENERVGVVDAESPEAKADNHGLTAWKKRKRGGKVAGDRPKMRMDRLRRHSDEPQDKALIRRMVKPEDLKRPERAAGGSVKGKKGTTVNVIIAPQGAGAQAPVPAPGGVPLPPPTAIRPPPVMAGPSPVGAGPAAGMAGPPPGMMRKDGGRVGSGHKYPKMDAGALSGEGRLEKIEKYGKK